MIQILVSFIFVSLIFSGTTGKLAGHVIDANSGEALIGCNILIPNASTGAATDINGDYIILNISPGSFDINVTMIGYAEIIFKNVIFSIDQTTRLNIQLNVEAIEGEAIIVQSRKMIHADVTNTEARITSEELAVMPVTDIHDVIKLQGGVTQDANGGIHIRGGRSSEVVYMVDGVSMTDAYDGGISVAVENNNIQELQVISGTFNAEYGRAMSGIINMVTKDGGNNFEGSFRSFSGDHFSTDEMYRDVDTFNPINQMNVEGQLSGPILHDRLSCFTSFRKYETGGWLSGLNTFDMYGDTLSSVEYRPMNWIDKWSLQNKFTFKLTPLSKLKFNYILSHEESQGYDHNRQMNQDGRATQYNDGRFMGLNLSHTFSPRSFMDINLSQHHKIYESKLFDSLGDARYVTPDSLYWAHIAGTTPEGTDEDANYFPAYSFSRWGVDTGQFSRQTTSSQFKFDYTNQINNYNQFKLGIDFQSHTLELDAFGIMDSSSNDQFFTPLIPQLGAKVDLSGGVIPQLEKGSLTLSDDIPSWVTHFHVNRSYYHQTPMEVSAFIQDKIEYGDMIVNLGLRYDYFDPNSWVPANPHEPYIQNPRDPHLDSLSLDERLNINWGDTSHFSIDVNTQDSVWYTYAEFGNYGDMANSNLASQNGWYQKTTPKSQWSPRFGIAYPISDKGVIHFSYGFFFQVPQFELLFKDPGYKMSEGSGKFGVYGNPDLEPQKTISYELGLQQELTRDLRFEVTGYYRDVRDWVTTGIPIDLGGGASYFTYVNKDYSNVRGILLSMDKHFSQNYAWHLDYTFQISEGSNSNPDEEFGAQLSNSEPTRAIIPLDWDQRHSINGSLYIGGQNWGGNLLMQIGSGYPYTPSFNSASLIGQNIANSMTTNSRLKQATINFDIKLYHNVQIGDLKGRVLMNIFNLFDYRNENHVWTDSGRSGTSTIIDNALLNESQFEEVLRPNTVADYLNHPEWYSDPRQIQFGLEFSW